MDANGQHFWLVRGGSDWIPATDGTLETTSEALRLASAAPGIEYGERTEDAEARLALVPMARDSVGSRAWYDPVSANVLAGSSLPGTIPIAKPPSPATDLGIGPEGWLYIVSGGNVLVRDTRGRYPEAEVSLPGFTAWRLAVDPSGGAWVLDRTNRQLAQLSGRLWPAPRTLPGPPEAFVPLNENPNPLRLSLVTQPWLEAGEDPVALACGPDGHLIVLVWGTSTADPTNLWARVRSVAGGTGAPGRTATLQGVARPFSLAWISGERFAALAAGAGEALVYTLAQGDVRVSGEFFPLVTHDGGPFLHGLSLPVEYPASPEARPLVSLSLPAFPETATAKLARPIDSGVAGTAWHRLYVEAEIPAGTSVTLWLAASDADEDDAAWVSKDWHPHHFGTVPPTPGTSVYDLAPTAVWVPARSEIPGFGGFIDEEPERDRAGLFTVLIQRAGRVVRTLRGRFLHLRLEMRGDNRATPCLHALRAYAPRFSYLDRYLPAVYREQVFGKDADAAVSPGTPPTRADFLGRWLANFEGVLTPLEDKVAESWLLTDPQSTPGETLEWLGAWIGVAFEPWYPAERRRDHLRRAPELFRRRGTLDGLRLALDVATGGGVFGDAEGRRRIVVVEDYWMRRTLATVLGVNLDREWDPLLAGPVVSGNSKVGRTLFLNDGIRREILALFDAAIPLNPEDAGEVDAFFNSLAHRATVLAHPAVSPEEFALIGRIVTLETPAHASVRVRRATHDFMVGLAALVGVDTYLLPPRESESVAVDASAVGEGNVLRRLPSLDPRIEGVS